jgi:hypothetical protein
MFSQSDNRMFERVSGELAVRYSPQGTDGEFCSTTKNISGGGIRIPLLKKVKTGATLDLEIFKNDAADMIFRCMGKVMWVWDAPMDKEKDHVFEAGIKFLNPDLFYVGRLMDSLGKASILT